MPTLLPRRPTVRWTYYQPTKTISPIIKAGIIAVSIVALSGGISFASLTSQNKFTGNTIRTATANLKLSADGGITYASTQIGYSFDGIVPGGTPVPINGYNFYVKNFGTTPLALKFSVGSGVSNPDGADLTKVHIFLSSLSTGSTHNFTLQSLIDSNTTGGLNINSPAQLAAGASSGYSLMVTMDIDAVVSASAVISNIDINVNGVL